ncbi:MAG: YdcF family protein [Oscillospiraceae bacterium]|nr:YdcF family protein [Oscillospiraceae bacterium]
MKASFHLLPWLICGILAALAFVLKFILPGYSFSALVCCCLMGIIGFYEITRTLLPVFPAWMPLLRKIFTVFLILGLLVVGITECIIIKASFGSPKEQVEYLVVLGAKVRNDGPSVSLWDRIYAAADYMEEHPDVIAVVSGGQGTDEPMTEAQAMYDELVKLGVDPERIWLEDKATSTWENMHFTLDLIEEKTGERPTKLGVLSSEYHLFRASLFADACGVDFVGIPARTSRFSQMANHFMREVAGVWHYILLGGQYD